LGYKLAIFDFDGTLADSFPWALTIYDEMIERYHLNKIGLDKIDAFRGMDARKVMKAYGVRWWKVPAIARDIAVRLSQETEKIALFEGVEALLRSLKERGVALALVTSSEPRNVRKILGEENAALFDHLECGVSLFGKKSKFKNVLRKSGTSAEEALCIGDEIRDIEAARKAHIDCAAVAWGYTNVEALRAMGPEVVFERVEDILEVF